MINPSRKFLETFVSWGDIDPQGFAPQDCWALRRGRPHLLDEHGERVRIACGQLRNADSGTFLCLPLVAQGETVGVLRLRNMEAAPDTEALQVSAQNMARQVALALANLRLRETLHSQSVRDPLTALYNRRYLEETLARELQRADRPENPLSVLMLDVDHFKTFNDTFGHDAGDHVLQELGRVMRRVFREEDVICRYGGEEFVVVLQGTEVAEAVRRSQGLRETVEHLSLTFRGQALGALLGVR